MKVLFQSRSDRRICEALVRLLQGKPMRNGMRSEPLVIRGWAVSRGRKLTPTLTPSGRKMAELLARIMEGEPV